MAEADAVLYFKESRLTSQHNQFVLLQLGNLDPISEVRGVKQRLANLGFDCGNTNNDELNEDLEGALSAFQSAHDLDVTGEIDQATRDKLKDVHGS